MVGWTIDVKEDSMRIKEKNKIGIIFKREREWE